MVTQDSSRNSIRLLGSFSVQINQQVLQWNRRKTEALIAYLAVHQEGKRRETLAALLWEDSNEQNANIALRRSLSEINQSLFAPFIDIQRYNVRLNLHTEELFIDVGLLEAAHQSNHPPDWQAAIKAYKGRFLEGFSVKNSIAFDDWQASTTQYYDDLAQNMMARLAEHYTQQQQYDAALSVWRQLYALNPLHESAVKALMQIYQHMGLDHAAAHIYQEYATRLDTEIAISPALDIQTIHEQLLGDPAPYYVPSAPHSFVGRETLIQTLVTQLQQIGQRLILQGWPGIGKTTITAALSHHQVIQAHFKDGILWTSLGEAPDLMGILSEWANAIGFSIEQTSVGQMRNQLQNALQDKKILLIIDDIWQTEHVQPLLLTNSASSTLLTTRFNDIARQVMIRADDIIKVPILDTEQSLILLQQLAPQVVKTYPEKCKNVVIAIEGLPLALQVVGRLLYEEAQLGWDVAALLEELCETHSLLSAQSPIDRIDIASQTTPTIASILYRSVAHLPPALQERFILLGVFAPKPATFTVEGIEAVWDESDIRADVRQLVNRGLLEPIHNQQFQMHALIAMLARSMVDGYNHA